MVMKSKTIIRLLCLVLCLSVLLPCVSAMGESGKVAAYLLRLRETASEKGKVLDAYPRGTKVKIVKKGDDWTKVEVHGKEGYMKTSLLSFSSKDSDSDSSSKDSGKKKSSISSGSTAYVVKGVRLNLRESANSSSEILGCFRGGTKVSVLKKGGYWSKVEVDGLTGYMANEYLTSEK